MELGGASVSGPRPYNEDTFLLKDLSAWSSSMSGLTAFIMVSDGMGGHQSGDVASRVAIETAESYIDDLTAMASQSALDINAEQALREIAAEANSAVIAAGVERGATSMGATMVAALISGRRVWIGHVGDSRAYLLRDGHARQLTTDHSAVGRMIAEGILTEEQAQSHPNRNVIERALGFSGSEAETTTVELEAGDAVMLCSDGLSTVLTVDDIVRVVTSTPSAQHATDSLTAEAIKLGTDDNTTAVLWADDWSLLRMSVPHTNDTRRARSKQRRQAARHANASRTSYFVMGFVALLAIGVVAAALLTGPRGTGGRAAVVSQAPTTPPVAPSVEETQSTEGTATVKGVVYWYAEPLSTQQRAKEQKDPAWKKKHRLVKGDVFAILERSERVLGDKNEEWVRLQGPGDPAGGPPEEFWTVVDADLTVTTKDAAQTDPGN